MKKLKRAFAALLSASLLMSQLSATAFAEEMVQKFSNEENAYESVLNCDVNQELSCTEVAHVHCDTCYGLIQASDSNASDSDATEILQCGLDEHEHDDSCYTTHEHDDGCYKKVEKESELTQLESKAPALMLAGVGSEEDWDYDSDSNTYTLSEDVEISAGMEVEDGATIIVNGDCVIDGGEKDAITCDGALTIEGEGTLTLNGKYGIKAASVAIDDVEVDFDTTSCGIYVYNEDDDAAVNLTNVSGKIVGDYAGIYVVGKYKGSNASVNIDECDLEVISEATSYNRRALNSGIVAYVSETKNVDTSITITDSKVIAIGADAGLCVNNYLGDADATNAACSIITIDNSTVVAEGTNGTWAGIFASVLGQHGDANSIIEIIDSSVYAVSPNTGILTSSQKGISNIILNNSILGASGKTALSMIEETCQEQTAELTNGSTYIQMTPDAVMKGEIEVFEGKTIVTTAGDGITYDAEDNYYIIPQGSVVTETFTDGTSKEYTFNNQAGGIGGSGYDKEEIWGYDGTGNEIIITTPKELINFATKTQDGTLGNCEGITLKLGNDIDMSGYDWYYRNAEGTIVTDHRIPEFIGTFDGQGYAVKNMSYRDEYAEATELAQLAFILSGKSDLKNLTIDGITVDTDAPAYFAGLVKDYAWTGSSDASVEKCVVKNVTVDADADFTFGGMFYRLVGGDSITDCHVEDITVNVKGALVGDNSGRNGGFVATGGEPMTFIDCSVTDLVVNAESTGNLVGGFIGGASMTGKYYNCDVNGFELNANAKFGAVGGFVATTAGSAWGSGLIMDGCDVSKIDINSTARISAAGGFVGYTAGYGKSFEDGAHNFVDCTSAGSIKTGAESKTGGFIGWLYGRNNGSVLNFENCESAVNVYSDNYGGAFVGYYVPYNTNNIIVAYNNCTASGDVFAAEPIGSFLDSDESTVDGIIGGTYNYDPENVDSETGETNNVAPGYRALNNGDGTWTVFPNEAEEVVEIAFHRWNDETDAYENWRTVEVYKNVAFVNDAYDNDLNYSHPDYRFADGLKELNDEVASAERPMTYWTDAEDGAGPKVLTNEMIIADNMNVYVAYNPSAVVCRIVETGNEYTTLTQAVADANALEGDNTIEMLKDIEFDSTTTLSVNGDLTIIGAGLTIYRGAYTGTMFTVPAGSSLTLNGGIVFDGSNNWIFNKEKYEYDLYNRVDAEKSEYAYSAEGGTCAIAAMFVVNGAMNAKDATIQNCFNTKDSNGGDGAIFKVNANATLDTDGVLIDHVATYGANAVAHLATNAKWYIKGETMISNNFGGRNGGICRNDSGQIYMSGGTIKNTAGKNVNGSVFMMYGTGSQFIMTDGTICSNSSVFGVNNGRCAAVYLHANAYMKMTGGTICHNVGGSRGGIDSYKTSSVLDINRVDQDFDNADWKESGAAAYTEANHPHIVGNVSLINYESHDVGHSYNFDTWWVTGGIYTQDVDEFCAEGYVCIPYDDSERTDDYIVVPGYRVNYYSVEKVITTDIETGAEVVDYKTTLEKKYFHLLPRDKFWYEMDERANYYELTNDEGGTISTWYCEKELSNIYDFANTKLESDVDVYGKWVVKPSEPETQPSEPETQPGEPETQPSEPAILEDYDDDEPEYTRPRPTQSKTPETVVVIDDQDIPLAAAPEDSGDMGFGVLGAFEIIDNMVPLAALPATGSSTIMWLMISVLSALGLVGTTLVERKKRK